jgi:hypothetical protein
MDKFVQERSLVVCDKTGSPFRGAPVYMCAKHGAHSSFTIRRNKTLYNLLCVAIKAHLWNGNQCGKI